VFAGDSWNEEAARANLLELFEKARGCRIEIIMKDVSTVRSHPERIDHWATLAMRMAADYAEASGLDG